MASNKGHAGKRTQPLWHEMKRRIATINKQVGANLRRHRRQADLSLVQVASGLDVSWQAVQKYETGKSAIASSTIVQLCQALQIKPNDLFSGTF
jgi:ribosome-binding protein aMBF1 (putative translation factor)